MIPPKLLSVPAVACFLVLACSSPPTPEEEATPDPVAASPAAGPAAMEVRGKVHFDPSAGSLEADLTVYLEVMRADHQDFLLAGALDLEEVSGPEVLGHSVEPGEGGRPWDRIRVELDPGRGPGRSALRFVYAGVPIMPGDGINRIAADGVELSFDSGWHPVVAEVDRELITRLELKGLPPTWAVVASGEARSIEDGFELDVEVPQVDISFAAAPGLEVARAEHFAVFHRGATEETTAAVLEAAEACRQVLDRRFGEERPLPAGRILITDRKESGYARKNYVVLTDVSDRRGLSLTEFLCHELAHFWCAGAKPLTVDNWLNEGFASLVAAQAAREIFGEEEYRSLVDEWRRRAVGQPSVWTEEDSNRRPWAVSYHKAPLALLRLEEKIGAATFDRVVVRALTDPVNDTPTLLAVIEEEAGPDARAWFTAVLAEDDTSTEPARIR